MHFLSNKLRSRFINYGHGLAIKKLTPICILNLEDKYLCGNIMIKES